MLFYHLPCQCSLLMLTCSDGVLVESELVRKVLLGPVKSFIIKMIKRIIFEIVKQGNTRINPNNIPLPDCVDDQIEIGIKLEMKATKNGIEAIKRIMQK